MAVVVAVMVAQQTLAAPAEAAEALVRVAARLPDKVLLEVRGLPMELIIGSVAVVAALVQQVALRVQQRAEMAALELKLRG